MSNYRPITDTWILARAKLKPNENGIPNHYYGAYLGGFPERARALLGVTLIDSVLHVCSGMARQYPYARGFGEFDKTMDIDAGLTPDFVHDIRDEISGEFVPAGGWPAILADPPYTQEDATNYATGVYPPPNLLLKNCVNAVRIGGRVGIIHYVWPSPPKNAISVAAVGILSGFNNRIRLYSVFERTK